jgi:probable F420-dependent oxidoreductase
MKTGVVFPQTEIGSDPAVIRDFAQAAEALGYSHILAYDHVLGAVHEGREPRLTGPYTEATPFHEPFVLFAYMAGVTSTIEFATGVIILPQRQTALVAKQAAQLDVLSGGRFRLGVGVGWNYVEYEALGEDFRNRGKRQEEQVEVMRRLWTEPVVDFRGRWHRIDRAGINPMPTRQIPVWFGGWGEVAWGRAARIGDGFIIAGASPDALTASKRIDELLQQHGRDRSSFGIEAIVPYKGGPERWAQQREQWEGAGVDYRSVVTMGAGLSPQGHIDALREYMEAAG